MSDAIRGGDIDRRNLDWYIDRAIQALVFVCGISAIIFIIGAGSNILINDEIDLQKSPPIFI